MTNFYLDEDDGFKTVVENDPRGLLQTTIMYWKDPSLAWRKIQSWIVKSEETEGKVVKYNSQMERPMLLTEQSVTILDELKERMETSVEARMTLTIVTPLFKHNPIQTQIETDKGLGVLLTDQFIPLAET